MWLLSKKIILFASLFFLISCKSDPPQTLRIAINPWPGYEVLHLAKEKGFFEHDHVIFSMTDFDLKMLEFDDKEYFYWYQPDEIGFAIYNEFSKFISE